MTEIGFGRDLVDFLLKSGRITHLIAAGKDKPMPITALMQRALAAGLTHVVPVDNGRVAIFAPDGIPSSLSIFGIVATDLRSAAPPDAGKSSITAMLDEIEGRLGAPGAPPDSPPGAGREDAHGAGHVDGRPSEPETAAMLSEVKRALSDLLARPVLGEEAVAETVERALQVQGAGAPDIPAAVAALSAKLDAAAEREHARNDAMLARLDALEANDAPNEALSRIEGQMERMLNATNSRAQNAELKATMARFSTALATVLGRLDSFSDSMIAAAATPPAESVSQVIADALDTAGLMSLSERLDTLAERLDEPQPKGQPGGESSDAIGAGLSDLARALSEGTERREIAATELLSRELGEISSLQHAIVTQLSALVDKRGGPPRNGMDEFLTDLRHAIAEIFADEKRKRLAG